MLTANLVGLLDRRPRTVMVVQVDTDEFLAGVGFSSWISSSILSSYLTSISVTTTFSLTPTLYSVIPAVYQSINQSIKRKLMPMFGCVWCFFSKFLLLVIDGSLTKAFVKIKISRDGQSTLGCCMLLSSSFVEYVSCKHRRIPTYL